MTFPVEIYTASGKCLTVNAKEDWSVWQLKCAIEKQTGTHPSLQKLVNDNCKVLLDGPLCENSLNSLLNDAPMKIYLVNMPKSQEDLEWFEKWNDEAPDWFKRLGEDVLDGYPRIKAFCVAAAQTATSRAQPLSIDFIRSRGGFPISNHTFPENHPTKTAAIRAEPGMKADADPVMKTSKDVLNVVKKCSLDLDSLDVDGQHVTMRWNKSHTSCIERKATLEAVAGAIVDEPSVMLDPLGRDASMDTEEIVSLLAPILAKHSGLYERLPDYLTENRDILYAALKGDLALKAEFLKTADRNGIRTWKEWQFPKVVGASRCRWSNRIRDD